MSNVRHCQAHGEYHESESGCPECQDTEHMAAGFDEALEITEGIVDGMTTESLDQRALRIAQEVGIPVAITGGNPSEAQIIDFSRRLLTEQAQQEPVAWMYVCDGKYPAVFCLNKWGVVTEYWIETALYAAPPQDSLDAKRLGHIYKQQMSIFIRPLMDYAEWIAAIDAAMREGGKL